jgi:hypothetical protein
VKRLTQEILTQDLLAQDDCERSANLKHILTQDILTQATSIAAQLHVPSLQVIPDISDMHLNSVAGS